VSGLLLPLCMPHYLLVTESPGPRIPSFVWQRLGLDTMLILRAHFPPTAGGGVALGVQLAFPEFCVWCEGPEPSDSFEFEDPGWSAEPTP